MTRGVCPAAKGQLLDGTASLEAFHAGHHRVQKDVGEPRLAQAFHGFGAAARELHVQAKLQQSALQQPQPDFAVIDHQDVAKAVRAGLQRRGFAVRVGLVELGRTCRRIALLLAHEHGEEVGDDGFVRGSFRGRRLTGLQGREWFGGDKLTRTSLGRDFGRTGQLPGQGRDHVLHVKAARQRGPAGAAVAMADQQHFLAFGAGIQQAHDRGIVSIRNHQGGRAQFMGHMAVQTLLAGGLEDGFNGFALAGGEPGHGNLVLFLGCHLVSVLGISRDLPEIRQGLG
jgi:hypothetical protein